MTGRKSIPKAMVASIIIPVKNGEQYIGECLDGIYHQQCQYPFEVIIIDSGSTDKTLSIIEKYPARLVQIQPGNFGHGKTRNYGASIASGQYLVYLTQDATPGNVHWLQTLIDCLQDPSVAGCYSRNLPRPNGNLLEDRAIVQAFPEVKEIHKAKFFNPSVKVIDSRLHHFSNVSSAIQRNVWEKIPFNEEATFAEDIRWAEAVLQAGYTIIYEPLSQVHHSHNYSLRHRFRRSYESPTGRRQLAKLLVVSMLEILNDWVYLASQPISILRKLCWAGYAIPYRSLSAVAQWLGSRNVYGIR